MSLMGASWSDCLRSWIVSGAGFWFHWVHAWGWLSCSVGVCWGLLWGLVAVLCFLIGDWLWGLEGGRFHWVFLFSKLLVLLEHLLDARHNCLAVHVVVLG
jgi:hypothetical protein